MIPKTGKYPICTHCGEKIDPEQFSGCDYSYSRGEEVLCEDCFQSNINAKTCSHDGLEELAEELGYKVESMY